MRVLRVFNNNVVLARDELGREAVLTGRGLGFQRRAGDAVDTSRIARRFIPVDNAASVGEVIAGIPLERLALIERTFRRAVRELGVSVPSSTVIAVVDHVNQAMERVGRGEVMDYPLRAEAAHLHPDELRLAEQMVRELNASQKLQLPAGEALLYLGGLAAVCAVNYIVFSLTVLYFVGYVLLAGYAFYALRQYLRHSRAPYRCGRCGARMRRKGRCPHCGAVNE